eukprot:scaffold100906_cov28-Tisochrysis_lutea.AAC.4
MFARPTNVPFRMNTPFHPHAAECNVEGVQTRRPPTVAFKSSKRGPQHLTGPYDAQLLSEVASASAIEEQGCMQQHRRRMVAPRPSRNGE